MSYDKSTSGQSRETIGMVPLPGMSDTDLALEAFASTLAAEQQTASDVAGKVAVLKVLQEQVWARHSKEVVMPDRAVILETLDRVTAYPLGSIGNAGNLHSGMNIHPLWHFRKDAHVSGHDLHIDTTAAIAPRANDVGGLFELSKAFNVLDDKVVVESSPNVSILGVRPVPTRRSGPLLKRQYGYDKQAVRGAVTAQFREHPRALRIWTDLKAGGQTEGKRLHDTGPIHLDWYNPDVPTTSLRANVAEYVLTQLSDSENNVEGMLGYLQEHAIQETPSEKIVTLRAINEILRESYPVIP